MKLKPDNAGECDVDNGWTGPGPARDLSFQKVRHVEMDDHLQTTTQYRKSVNN